MRWGVDDSLWVCTGSSTAFGFGEFEGVEQAAIDVVGFELDGRS
jgi:hypothetical protein